jgi:uncharacterized protein (DUF1778 family)
MNMSDDVGRINDERTDLKAADHERFFEALDLPPTPTEALRAAFRRRKEAGIRTDIDGLSCS